MRLARGEPDTWTKTIPWTNTNYSTQTHTISAMPGREGFFRRIYLTLTFNNKKHATTHYLPRRVTALRFVSSLRTQGAAIGRLDYVPQQNITHTIHATNFTQNCSGKTKPRVGGLPLDSSPLHRPCERRTPSTPRFFPQITQQVAIFTHSRQHQLHFRTNPNEL